MKPACSPSLCKGKYMQNMTMKKANALSQKKEGEQAGGVH